MDIRGKWNKNEYKLIELIGSGNFGKIYRIEDSMGKIKAAKISKDLLSITNEYTAMINLEDMFFVPKVYDLDDWEYKGKICHFIIMDYIYGANLKDLNDHKQLNFKTIFKIGEILLKILRQIDRLGYKYTDIKLENIMVDEKSNIYLVDFGSLIEKNKATKEYTPTYNINSWNISFHYTYEMSILFSVTMIMVSLLGKIEYNPLIYDIEQVIDKIESLPLKKDWKQFLTNGLKGDYKTFNQYFNSLSLLFNDKEFCNSLSKIDYLLIISIVSFVFIVIVGIKSIFY